MSKFSFVFKAMIVAFLSVLLLVPLTMINGTISERIAYRDEAVASVERSTAGAQSVAGPVLVVPYSDDFTSVTKNEKGEDVVTKYTTDSRWIFFPKTMNVDGRLKPSTLERGNYKVRVYELDSTVKARFSAVLPDSGEAVRRIGKPYLSLSLADVRGLVGTPVLKVNQVPTLLVRGVGDHRQDNGLHAMLPAMTVGQTVDLAVDLSLALSGTERLAVAPIGDSNRIVLASDWPHPKFEGRFLPRSRNISDAGFTATWEISALAAGTQGQYLKGASDAVADKTDGAAADVTMDQLGVALVDPVNVYSQIDRASKYGFLFVMLTFIGFFMFELIKRLAIHPIQYGLVGLALAIFFLLLLSLSEHVDFWIAYLSASVACIGLLGFYLSSVLRSKSRGIGFAAMLTLLYAALYGLLVSEDNALVLGSLMMFAILAAIMLITRNVDWYALGSSGTTPPPIPSRPDAAASTAAAS